MVSFTGWGECQAMSRGIRIGISAFESGTVALGQHLDGVRNGMQLRVDFSAFKECAGRNSFCVRATAVHEFGHALGFAHEQNRTDAPDWCKAKHAGDLPDRTVTAYDDQSIMNYCNKAWNNDGMLSDKDIEAVGRLYGARA
ncbi:Matrixin (fragment) (plasmid) [Cupriavidus taiwanensis]|uniref:Matrixin n=1 Tax=Cupriavidus taiwanensis TaxID=164546 RepID=A0A9Q7XS36_9BURK